MTKEIKVGDWVRLKKDQEAESFFLDKNKLYRVLEVIKKSSGSFIYVDADRPDLGLLESRFDLIRSIDDGFKIGDVINWCGEDSGWKNITIEKVGNWIGDVKYGEGKRFDGALGGFYIHNPETELVSVVEEEKIESSDGRFKMYWNGRNFETMELHSKIVEKSHILTAVEAKQIVDETYVSLDDVVNIYNWLTDNGFMIKKVG